MTTEECEHGCECGDSTRFENFDLVMDENDFNRLIREKAMRARRYIELQEKIEQRLFD